ncbi:uncharacterized protein LAESUDRAFT_556002 [Laetiporus sulphureus 93-53]|uniref:Phenylalanine ammonia-lyase n=1 Tax=Laetiporus sulphureus 93-53 TaxID=1314785 RepID=A0A165B6W2_9APHY|nr:uncharacterized protein LAESUDRAFT_556002 [Laetiporus sulphureus 93-53]KZT00380.1 hypothetical protein LAESUDRAFT_556002 [Laetiporus sulphureus 93-53]
MTENSQPLSSHLDLAVKHWSEVVALRSRSASTCTDGESFTVAGVVAVARFGIAPDIPTSHDALQAVEQSAQLVTAYITAAESGKDSMYGVTTGFGGSETPEPDRRRSRSNSNESSSKGCRQASYLLEKDGQHCSLMKLAETKNMAQQAHRKTLRLWNL